MQAHPQQQQNSRPEERYFPSYYAEKQSPPYKRGDSSDSYATLTPAERKQSKLSHLFLPLIPFV